jgi:hypothetical protein
MAHVFSIFFMVLSLIGFGLLVFGFFRIIQRKKLLKAILGLPDTSRDQFVVFEKNLIRAFGIFLLFSPVLLVLMPLALFNVLRQAFVSGTICMAVMVGGVLQEYLLRKWLVNHLESLKPKILSASDRA